MNCISVKLGIEYKSSIKSKLKRIVSGSRHSKEASVLHRYKEDKILHIQIIMKLGLSETSLVCIQRASRVRMKALYWTSAFGIFISFYMGLYAFLVKKSLCWIFEP